MKKLLLFLTLLIVGMSAQAQYTPANNLNYVKLLKTPPVGSVQDSVVVYDGSDGFLKMRPSSILIGKSTATKTGTVKTDVTESDPIVYTKATADELLKLKAFLSTGLLKNGLLTINADNTKFDLSAGIGVYSDFSDPENVTSKVFNFPAFNAVLSPYLATSNITYVAVNYNSGSPVLVMQASPFLNTQIRDLVVVGAVIHSNFATINTINNISSPSNDVGNSVADIFNFLGARNQEGNVYSANGANLQLNKSAGVILKYGANFHVNAKNPHNVSLPEQLSLTFRYRLQGGFEGTDRINVDTDNYDLNNVLTTVPPAKPYQIKTIFIPQTGQTRIQYGQTTYNTLADAVAAINTRKFVTETNLAAQFVKVAYLVVKKGATSLQVVADADIIQASKFDATASGGVAITYQSIIDALTFTPENVVNKVTSLTSPNNTTYPTTQLLKDQLDAHTLQKGYDNSTSPQITTNPISGALDIKNGNISDANPVFRIQNLAGTSTVLLTGEGGVFAQTYNAYIPENSGDKVTSISASANNTNYPSELAVKTYADNLVVGMLNDRGTWDASVNVFPTTGGSGTAGAIRKGDMWYVSVAGILGGKSVNVGDSFRALVNSPAQIASNWSVLEANIGYVPENVGNKTSGFSLSSTTTYPNTTALVDGLATKENTFSKNTAFNKNFGTAAGTVSEGNDSRILNGQTAFSWGNHAGLYPTYNGTGATGTWGISVTGNSGSTTNWGGNTANFSTEAGIIDFATVFESGIAKYAGAVKFQSWLGLGTNAYTSTAYLPLSGGTVSGTITASPATVDTELATLGQVTALTGTSGTYTPTTSALNNVTSISSINGTYAKIGNIVNCTVSMSVNVTSSGEASFSLVLPVTPTGTIGSGSGTALKIGSTHLSVYSAKNGNQQSVIFIPLSSGTHLLTVSFQYSIN